MYTEVNSALSKWHKGFEFLSTSSVEDEYKYSLSSIHNTETLEMDKGA